MEIFDNLRDILGNNLRENELLAPFTSFKIGGPATYLATTNSAKELGEILAAVEKAKLPFFILGGGSNILVSDKGFDGLVIKLNFSRLEIKDDLMECESGVSLSKAVGEAAGAGLSGLEWAAGIPGTIGGAVCGNCGAYGGQIADGVREVTVLRRGKEKKLDHKGCRFGYRKSIFSQGKNGDIVLSVELELKRGDATAVAKKIKEILKARKEKFDCLPSAGSVFGNVPLDDAVKNRLKNKKITTPEDFFINGQIPAGWLIDQCGLKGKKIGGAMVSEKHANVIVNTGGATAEDVVMLISIIKQKVRSRFGLQLMEEIKYVGF